MKKVVVFIIRRIESARMIFGGATKCPSLCPQVGRMHAVPLRNVKMQSFLKGVTDGINVLRL